MNIILCGPPGSGKGTQATLLCNKLNIINISVGDILRNAFKNKNNQLKAINAGKLIPNNIVFDLVRSRRYLLVRLLEVAWETGQSFLREALLHSTAMRCPRIQITWTMRILGRDGGVLSPIQHIVNDTS